MSVYFIQHGNLVKIGFSENLAERVASVRASIPVPVTLLGHMPGGKDVERHFHRKFAAARRVGEWFEIGADDLASLILILDTEIPERKRSGATHSVQLTARNEWDSTSERLRTAAVMAWPFDTHKSRKIKIADRLGWGERRARQIYDGYGHGRVTAAEVTAVEQFEAELGPTPQTQHDNDGNSD